MNATIQAMRAVPELQNALQAYAFAAFHGFDAKLTPVLPGRPLLAFRHR